MTIRIAPLILLSIVLAGGYVAPAAAQALLPGLNNPVTDPGADARKAEDNRRIAEFKRGDTDGDGILSRREAADLFAARFDVMDDDANGLLVRGEFRLNRLDAPEGGVAGLFSRLDRDGDDALSREEWIDGTFEEADLNKDGELSIWEYRTRD